MYNINNSNINRENIRESINVYFDKIYNDQELKNKYEVLNKDLRDIYLKHKLGKNVVIPQDIWYNTETFMYDKFTDNSIDSMKSIAGYQAEKVSKKYFNLLGIKDNEIIYEPNGENTHPDFLIKYKNNNINVEIKSVLCNEFTKNNQLNISVNNATNSKFYVQTYLDEYKKYVHDHLFNITEFKANNNEKSEARQFFETFVIFFYYYIDYEHQGLCFFDFDIIPLPIVLDIKLQDDGKINNEILFGIKCNGNAKNDNVNLRLTLYKSFNNENNLLSDPIMLYLQGKTHLDNNYVISNNKYKEITAFYSMDISLKNINNLDNVNSLNDLNNLYTFVKDNHKSINKYKHIYETSQNYVNYNSCYNNFINLLYKKKLYKLNYKEYISLYNKLENQRDFDMFTEFKSLYHQLRKYKKTDEVKRLYNNISKNHRNYKKK